MNQTRESHMGDQFKQRNLAEIAFNVPKFAFQSTFSDLLRSTLVTEATPERDLRRKTLQQFTRNRYVSTHPIYRSIQQPNNKHISKGDTFLVTAVG